MTIVAPKRALDISIAVRSAQGLLSFSVVAMASVIIGMILPYSFNRNPVTYAALCIACGAIEIIHFVLIMTPAVSILSPMAALLFECFLFILWMVAAECAASYYGPLYCNGYDSFYDTYYGEYDYYRFDGVKIACETGKGIIGVSVVGLLLSVVLLVLVFVYSVIPAAAANAIGSRNWFDLGGIFPKYVNTGLEPKFHHST